MTKLKFFLSCLAVLSLSLISSLKASHTMLTDTQELRMEIHEIFKNLDLTKLEIEDEMKVVVSFLINEDNELVVLRTDQPHFDKFLKNHLNYTKLKYQNNKVNRIYILPITLQV